jgi:hypothetical protein
MEVNHETNKHDQNLYQSIYHRAESKAARQPYHATVLRQETT